MASEQNRQHSRQKPVFILVQYCTGSFRIQKLIVPPAPNTADVLRGLRDLYGGVSAHGYSLSEQIWQMVIMHRLIIGKVQVLGVLVKSSIRIYQGLTAIQVTDVEGRIVPNEHIHKISTTAAIVWVSMVVLVALTVGLGVGFGAGDGKLGFDVGTGLLAVYMPIHGALLFRFS
ncbi:hypothetical protein HBI24_090460 [Parastagonospora nodorum]|nr:hypothetical protein HBI24_090460 [Parastagonospora nodorum]